MTKRSESGAVKPRGKGEMTGAKRAMNAKMRTMERPAKPKRLWRNTAQIERKKRRTWRQTHSGPNWIPGDWTSDPDTRIEHSVQDVSDDVCENDEDGQDEEDRAREEVVLVQDCLEKGIAQAEVGKDLFEDDRASDREREGNREGCHHGQIRVPRRMPPPHNTLRKSLRPRSENEVLAHDLEHRRLHEQDRAGCRNEDEGEHRERCVHKEVGELEQDTPGVEERSREMRRRPLGVAETAQGEPVRREGEDPKEDQPNPERWHVIEEKARDDRGALRDLSPFPCDVPADKDPHRVLEHRRASEEEERSRGRVRDDVPHGPSFQEGRSEVEGEHVAQILEEGYERRVVDSELLA